MNQTTFKYACLFCITTLFLVSVPAQSYAQAPAGLMQKEFDALSAYEFGMSREPVYRIFEAVRAAVAGHPEGNYTVQDLEMRLVETLQKEISPEAKDYICRMLGEIGGAGSVEALASQFADKKVFPAALVALEQNKTGEAAAALAALLNAAEPQEKTALVEAIGRQGNPVSVSVLAAALEDPNLVQPAALALAALKVPEACGAVISKMADAAPEVKGLLADAFLKCACCVSNADAEAYDALLDQFHQSEFPIHIRLAAISIIMQRHPEKAQELLLTALQDEDAEMAHDALMLVRENPGANIVTAIAGLLEQASPERQVSLLAILSDFRDASVLPVVLKLAEHEQPEVRISALQAVGALGKAEQVEFLLARANSGPAKEQRTAREMLTRLADPAANERLLKIASSPGDEKLRALAIAVLADRNAGEAAPVLLKLALRATPGLRQEAVRALRTLAPPEMLPELLALVVPRALEPVRELLPQTIAQTATRVPDPLVQADAIIKALNGATAVEVQAVLLESLGLLGTSQAFEAIKSYPNTTEIEVRRAMVSALSRFQSPEALNELRSILLTERDEGVRARAYSGYIASLRNASNVALRDVIPHLQTAYEQAKSPAELRDLLAAATQLPSLATLRIIESVAEKGGAAAEVSQAMVKVCIALAGAYPEEARGRLESLIAEGKLPDALKGQAQQALDMMQRFEGYIMAWAVAGPYFEANVSAESLFSREFVPETAAENADWRVMPVLPDANPAYVVELDRVLGGENRVAFLRTRITADAAADAVLELGTNDGCRVWLNGMLIHALNEGRALTPGQDKLPVQLAAGENDLMIAVFQQGGAWSAAARFVGKDGQPLPGIVCRPAVNE